MVRVGIKHANAFIPEEVILPRLRQNTIAREIVSARDALRALDHSLRRLTPFLSEGIALHGAPMKNGRPRPRLSAKGRASLILQGRYMGYMRQLGPKQKAQVRRIREMQGVKAAISRARQVASS